ncbi:MAG: hypothetical protein WC449_05210 [Candidatus Paceibacterota bacterium]
MNRREFLTLGLFLPVFPKLATTNNVKTETTESMSFPIVFAENTNQTNKVSISYLKSNNIFEQLWQDILQIIK